jgi:hypothetical protein
MPESARGRVHFFWIIVVALFSGQNSRKSLSAGKCGRKPWFDHGCTSEYEVYLHFFPSNASASFGMAAVEKAPAWWLQLS